MKKFRRTGSEKRAYTAPEEKKKRFSGPTIFAIVVVGLMAISGIGYMWEGGNSFIYNNYKFEELETKFVADIDGDKVDFRISPYQAETVNVSNDAIAVLKNTKMIYMTSDPKSISKDVISLAEFELKNSLEAKGIYAAYAFFGENQYNLTQMTCANATIMLPVIYFRNSNDTRIDYDNGCIILESSSDFGFMMLKDRMMYGFYGII